MQWSASSNLPRSRSWISLSRRSSMSLPARSQSTLDRPTTQVCLSSSGRSMYRELVPALMYGVVDSSPQVHDSTNGCAKDEQATSDKTLPLHDLSTWPVFRRQQRYAELWKDTSTSLTHLSLPDLIATHPTLATEISSAFITHTTIAVDVWINFDAASQHFFHHPEDRRADSCGKVVLSPRQRAGVETLLHGHVRGLHRIRLDIGSPFRLFAHIYVEVMFPASPPRHQRYHPYAQPRLAASLVLARSAQLQGLVNRELWDTLCCGCDRIISEVPVGYGRGTEILLEDLDRWAGYFLHARYNHRYQASFGYGPR